MRDVTGRIDRLEKRVTRANSGWLILTVPYSAAPAAQQKVLEKNGLTPSDLAGRNVLHH